VSRVFLGGRKTADPAKTERAVAESVAEWRTLELRNALGMKFRASMQVQVRRPRWMPDPLYRWFMRTIVVPSKLERLR